MPRNLLPSPHNPPSLSPLLQAQNIASLKWPRPTRLVFRRRLPVQHITWTASTTNMDRLPTSYSPLPTVARQSATQLSHTTFSQFSEPTQESSSIRTLLFPFPARFSALHCRPFSLALSSSPQAGCRRYNPSNAALPSTVRLLPTCSVGTSICLSRTTNLPLSGQLSITASTISNWRGKGPQRNPMPFLPTTSKESSYAGRNMMSRWPISYGQDLRQTCRFSELMDEDIIFPPA